MGTYRLLHIEDNEDDLFLVAQRILGGGMHAKIDHVDTIDGIRDALARNAYDAVLADFELQDFDGMDALRIIRKHDAHLPFILISGMIGEQTAIELMRAGAQDFVMKDSLARLSPVIEREVREAEMRRQRDVAENANVIKSEFLASMSHELRTPLNSILGFTSILLDGMAGALNEEQAKQVTMVHSAGERLLRLVNDILDLSKIEAGKHELRLSEFLLGDAAKEVVDLTRVLWEEKGLTFEIIDEHPDETVHTDRAAVEQIFGNLVGNAIKYTACGGIVLCLRSDGDSQVMVDVIDTGEGISPDELTLVFDEFHQTLKNHDPDGGTGLGLTISRKLARALGGDISVQSEVGSGSTFTLSIPRICPDCQP